MKEIIISSDKYKNCPICNHEFKIEKGRGYIYDFHAASEVQVFLCLNPLVSDPLHSYTHIVDVDVPNQIAYQEFALDLGNKYVLFANNYKLQTSAIKNNKHGDPLLFPFIIMPDFPNLNSLKNRVKTVIVFS
jgi:hypothetical protein